MNHSLPDYFVVDRLAVEVHPDRASASRAAAHAVAAHLCDLIARRLEARIIFACAPSQDEFFAALVDPANCGAAVDWSRVTAFHMDDYVGLTADHPQSFRSYLQAHFLRHVRIGCFHPIPAEDPDTAATCARYAGLLRERPIDLVCLGIGENGHIAFNDPPADFDDPTPVRVVELDAVCRQQQVNDGCFPMLDAVPRRALTLTVPVFRRAHRLSAHVFGKRKAAAVRAALHHRISPVCPASVLRLHPAATLYLDAEAVTGK